MKGFVDVVVVLVLFFSCVPVRPPHFGAAGQWKFEGGLLHSQHIRCVSVWCVEVCEREKRDTALPLCCVEVCEEGGEEGIL